MMNPKTGGIYGTESTQYRLVSKNDIPYEIRIGENL